MKSWPRHIDRFELQYDKDFARDPIFGTDLMDRIHKRLQVFLHSCNTTAIKEVEMGSLAEFGGLQKNMERGEWLTSTPVWVEWPEQKEEGLRKSDRNKFGARQSGGRGGGGTIFNHRIDPQLKIIENMGNMKFSSHSENLRLLFARDPIFGTDLMDRIHKRLQVFLHSCNTTAIKEVEMGSLAEFGGLQKNMERGEWLTSTPVWVEWPEQKEEGLRKSDRNKFGARQSGGRGGGGTIFNHRIDPQLKIIENMGNMKFSAHSENLRLLLVEDGREICLHFISKEDCVRSCTCFHAPLRGHHQDLVIHYIRGPRELMNQFNKRKYDGDGYQGSHGGHWDRGGNHGHCNLKAQHNSNGAIFGGGLSEGRDGNNGRGGGA